MKFHTKSYTHCTLFEHNYRLKTTYQDTFHYQLLTNTFYLALCLSCSWAGVEQSSLFKESINIIKTTHCRVEVNLLVTLLQTRSRGKDGLGGGGGVRLGGPQRISLFFVVPFAVLFSTTPIPPPPPTPLLNLRHALHYFT